MLSVILAGIPKTGNCHHELLAYFQLIWNLDFMDRSRIRHSYIFSFSFYVNSLLQRAMMIRLNVSFLHAYYAFLSTPDYTNFYSIICNFLFSATTQRAFRSKVDILSTLWWSRLIWHYFVKVAGT